MIKAFQHLHSWLVANGIEPHDFKVVLLADPVSAERIASVFGHEMDQVQMRYSGQPVRSGQICAIPFSIEPFPIRMSKADLDKIPVDFWQLS